MAELAKTDSNKDNSESSSSNSPEEKIQKLLEQELKDIEELIDETTDLATLRNIAKKQLRAQVRKKLMLEDKYLDVQYERRDLKKDLEHHQKLSTIVFSRWILELMKNNFLSKFDGKLQYSPTTKGIKAAWIKFFEASDSGDQKAGEAREKILEMIPVNSAIMKEVDRIRSAPGTCSQIDVKSWLGRRSTELYFKYSDIIHNLKKINWMLDTDALLAILNDLPKVNDFDRDLISIFHSVLVELFPDDMSIMPSY